MSFKIQRSISLIVILISLSLITYGQQAHAGSIDAIQLNFEKVHNIVLYDQCKIVRSKEPRGNLRYKKTVGTQEVITTVKIFSDLCLHPTQQFLSRLFLWDTENGSEVVVGFLGSNEDGEDIAFPVFSSFVFKLKK